MSRTTGLWRRVQRSLFRRRFEADVADEMRTHIEMETERRIAAGEDPVTARRRASAEFGSVDARVEEVREHRLGAWVEQFWQDLRFAARQLRKSPGFTLVAIATLAVGIGANTAIFSGVDAVLLRSLPYPEADRLVGVYESPPRGGRNAVSGRIYLDWKQHQTQFEALFIAVDEQLDLTGRGDPEKIEVVAVSSDFDEVFGLPPLIGRHFAPEDDLVGGNNNVVMLSEGFWRSRFGGSVDVLNQTLILDGTPRQIIGVLPNGIWHQGGKQVFVPLVLTPGSYRVSVDVHMARVYGRLKPDATLASATAELRAIKANMDDTYPDWKRSWSVGLVPLQDVLASYSRPFLLMLLGATSLVLLIACANVANLLLARATARQREIALRAALGASGSRIVRQVLTESTLLALIGGVAGLLVAYGSIQFLSVAFAHMLPASTVPQLDLRVLGFGLTTSLVTGLVFGLFPALRARRTDLNHNLKSGTGGTTDGGRSRSQSSLVVAEIALTAVLLVGTGLLVRGMVRSVTADPGINVENVLMFELTPPYAGNYGDPNQRLEFLQRVRNELQTVPGVISVASADDLPFDGNGQGYTISREEKPETRQDLAARIKYVSADYFATLRANILRGRAITAEDNRPGAPDVIVINETLARLLFAPDEDPVGRLLNSNNRPWEVVGVVRDIRIDELHTPPQPMFFAPQAEFVWYSGYMVRTQGDPTALATALSAKVHRLDPNLPLANVQTLAHALNGALGPQRLTLNLISVFAFMALTLAAIGLYGVMAFAVANRRRELSIRVALGAARHDIMQLVLQHGGRLLTVGLTVGLLGGIAVAQGVASYWSEVNAADPLVFVTAGLVLAVVTLLATWLPARRAAQADPIAALRAE